jgi:hypothetical protein
MDEAFNLVDIKTGADWRVRLQILGGLDPTFAFAKSGRTKSLMVPKGTLQALTKSSLYKSNFSSYFQSAGQFLELPRSDLGHVLDTIPPKSPGLHGLAGTREQWVAS